jgi:hypothetical protein
VLPYAADPPPSPFENAFTEKIGRHLYTVETSHVQVGIDAVE